MFEKFKKRWNINSNFQLIIILFVFAITGSTTLYVRKAAFFLLGITSDTSLLIKVPLYILIIFPVYQVLFLIIGTLLGQFNFAWNFEKKVFGKFIPGKKKEKVEDS
jgi:hypothetical protein